MNSFKKNSLLTLPLLAIYILCGFVSYGDHSWMLFLTLTSCFFISIFIFKKQPKKEAIQSILFLIAPLLIILLTTLLIYGQYSRTVLYIFFIPISSLLAYSYFKYKHIVILVLSIGVFGTVGFFLFQNVLILIENKNAEKNVPFPAVSFTDENKSKVHFDNTKIVVLDFWTTSCGICFSKFPDLESTYLKYKENPNVVVYAVNVPLRNDKFEKTTQILNKIGYTFPKIYAISAKQIEDSLKINSFPHLLILKNNRIRYDGILETDKKVLTYSIEYEIEKLLSEK